MAKAKAKISEEDWEQRYASWWSLISKLGRFITLNRCVLNPLHQARLVHHAYYGFRIYLLFWTINLPIPGFELIGLQLFPLCNECHSKRRKAVHHVNHWHWDKKNPVWKNRNRAAMHWQLVIRFWVWVLAAWGFIFWQLTRLIGWVFDQLPVLHNWIFQVS